MAQKKIRLDDYLVEQGYFSHTGEALRAVLAHTVKVNDVYASSAALPIKEKDLVEVKGARRYVSRGGKKLEGALKGFNFSPEGMRCIDIGSSTGGFTDCLLQAKAAEVTCVDVNYGQLAWEIRTHPNVKVFERTNIKLVNPRDLHAPFDLAVCDVSFIGMAGLAPVFAHLVAPGGYFIGLIKPQFESEHHETDQGIVRDPKVHARVIAKVKKALADNGFEVTGVIESPITGAQGNIEFLVQAKRTGA